MRRAFLPLALLTALALGFVGGRWTAPPPPLPAQPPPSAPFASPPTWRCVEILDGDTINVVIDVDGTPVVDRVRLVGIDAPEIEHERQEKDSDRMEWQQRRYGRTRAQIVSAGNAAADRLRQLVPTDAAVRLVHLMDSKGRAKRDKYRRLLAYVEVDSVDVGLTLLHEGFAWPYEEPNALKPSDPSKPRVHPRLAAYAKPSADSTGR